MSNLPELSPSQQDVGSLEKPFSALDGVADFCPKISTSYVISVDDAGRSLGRPGGKLSENFLEVDHGFRYTEPRIDPGFSYFQVEALLDQAADLLERCMVGRQLYDAYAVSAFNLGLELQEFCKLADLHDRETEAGFYSVTYSRSYDEWQAQYAQTNYVIDTKSWRSDHIDRLTQSAFGFGFVGAEIGKDDPRSPVLQGGLLYSAAIPNIRTLEEKHDPSPQESLYPNAAAYVARFNYLLQAKTSEAQGIQAGEAVRDARVSFGAAEWMEASSNKLQYYDYVSAGFQYERTLISRWREGYRAQAATDPGGVLDYIGKMDVVRKRVLRDLNDALGRLSAASDGLRILFGYDGKSYDEAQLPQSLQYLLNGGPAPAGKTASDSRVIDDAIKWVRDAIAFMVRFAHRDQGCAIPLSLKSIAKDWKAGLVSAPHNWKFDLSNDYFLGLRHVRLCGVTVYVESKDARGLWIARVNVPPDGECWHVGASGPVVPLLDQRQVPEIIAGRVRSRDAVREPDVIGVTALHNVSPIGKEWQLTLSPTSTSGLSTSEIDDIVIDLHLVVRSPKVKV